jgi:hypothetical protein
MAKSRNARKNRRSRSRRQRGGAGESLAQGAEYLRMMGQRGGALLTGAPVGHDGMLEAGLRAQARVGELDSHMAAARAQGPDQVGGRRNSKKSRNARNSRNSKKSRNARNSRNSKKSRNARKSRNSKKSRRSRSRRQRGGRHLEGADYNASPMLLNDYSKAGLPSFKAV